MSLRHFSKRGAQRREWILPLQRRRVLLEQLESRQLLAGDVMDAGGSFLSSLPTADETGFGAMVVTSEGRDACLAFRASGSGEGESLAPPPEEAAGPVDLSASITQPTGPLATGAAFTSEITFENAGPGDATATNLTVGFDANLAGITWEREIIRAQSAVVSANDLDGNIGFTLQGADAGDNAGFSVAGSGDFNGDGIDDLIVGAIEPDTGAGGQEGEVYVVFGSATGFPASIDLGALNGTNGFALLGVSAGSSAGTSVANAGDVNGDTIDDLIVGASSADPGGNADAGQAYVVFGKNTAFAAQVNLSALNGTDGFSLAGVAAGDALGTSVAGLGDVNGDSIADVIIGAPGKSVPRPGGAPGTRDIVGQAYVVFGSAVAFGASIDLATLSGANGFAITTGGVGDQLGFSVDGAGDLNDDGIRDIVVGAVQSSNAGGNDAGKVFVVYGKNTAFSASVDVSSLNGTTGFSVSGPRAGHNLGTDVAGIGDFNGDGIDDLAMADGVGFGATIVSAKTYVLFGRDTAFAAAVDISGLNGSTGLVVDAPVADHPNQMRVSGTGDINGDGVSDLLIGLPATSILTPGSPTPTDIPGGGYVVYGSLAGFASPLNLGGLNGLNGFLLEGTDIFSQAGEAVGAAGDVNNDGLADIVLGAPFGSPAGRFLAGESHVYFGRGSTVSTGAGAINETLDLGPGDRVIYRVSATIAPAASGSTVVTATATEGPGITETNNLNNSASASTTISSPVAPAVESIVINDGSASRSQITSLTVTFDSVVDHGPLTNAFLVTQIDTNTPVGIVTVSPDSVSVPGKTVVTLTFGGTSTVDRVGSGALGDSLADGNYRLNILAANVVAGGTAMTADEVFGGQTAVQVPNDNFFRLLGDTTGDGFRNGNDLNEIIPTLFSIPNYRSDLDTNGDGSINGIDINDLIPTLFGAPRL